MDKLKAIAGGQPLRVDDWTLIQDQGKMGFAAMIASMIGDYTYCILTGLVRSHVDATFVFSEGYVYVNGEIYHVPEATLSDHKLYYFFIQPVTTTSENRAFHDASTHDVYELRSMVMGEDPDAVPSGAINYNNLLTLRKILEDDILSKVPGGEASLVSYITHSYSSGVDDDLARSGGALLIPAPGEDKMIKIISCSASIQVTTPLVLGAQNLNLAYGDTTTPDIGFFPNSFLKSAVSIPSDMRAGSGYMAKNQAVTVGYSAEGSPSSGYAVITLYCLYKIIDIV